MSFQHLNGVMFDIETLGKRPGSVVLSIGACRFDIDSKRIYDEFYVTIDAQDQMKNYGLKYDKSTLEWWKDNPAALKGIQKGCASAESGFNRFFEYLSKKKGEPIWAMGPHFDIPIVQEAMHEVLKIEKMPWKYWDVYDVRTVQNVFGEQINREEGVHHNALDDAKVQAKYLIEFFNKLG